MRSQAVAPVGSARSKAMIRFWRGGALALLFFSAASAFAQNPAPNQIFYIPLPDTELLATLLDVDADAAPNPTLPILRTTSIGIASAGTLVYYDRGSNGYVTDIANPTLLEVYSNPGNLDGVQIWGDGNTANGAPPGVASDLLGSGTVITLDATSGYTAGDKIGVAGSAGVVMGAYPQNIGTVLAGGTEILDTATAFGTDFRVPVGNDVNGSYPNRWEVAEAYLIASQNGTTISLNGVPQGAAINEGQTRKLTALNRQDVITASAPVGGILVTGDRGSNYEMRWEDLVPVSKWTNSYVLTGINGDFTVVAYPKTQRVVFFSTAATTVSYTYGNGTTGSITVNATDTLTLGSVNWIDVPANNGARFTSPAGTSFWGVSLVGAAIDDWGVPLYPTALATESIVVPLGYGCTGGTCQADGDANLTADRSAVFVTPDAPTASNITVYVDYDGLSGPRAPVTYVVGGLDTVRLLDSDQDMSGALIYTLDGTKLVGIWGQFSTTPNDGEALDLGTLSSSAAALGDYGDAPVSYGSVSHRVVTGLRLGAEVDFDGSFYGDANAILDDQQSNGGNVTENATAVDGGPTTSTFSWTGAVAIPNNNTAWTSRAVTAAGLNGPVEDINLRIDGSNCAVAGNTGIQHNGVSDLEVRLTSPGGVNVLLIDNRDGTGDNFCQTLLDDEGLTPINGIAAAAAPFSNTYTPDAPLSTFDGQAGNGNWSIGVRDIVGGGGGGNGGTLRGFSVILTSGVANAANATGAANGTWTGDIAATERLSLQFPSGMSAGNWIRVRARSSDGSGADETATLSFCSAANSGCAANTLTLTVEDPDSPNPGPDKYYDLVIPAGVTNLQWLRIVGTAGAFQVDCATVMKTNPVDDEDGVVLSYSGKTVTATVTATNTTGSAARLCGYLDGGVNSLAGLVTVNGTFQRDAAVVGGSGPGNGSLEERCVAVPIGTTNGSFSLSWYFPATSDTTTYARFRLSTDASFLSNSSPSPTGALLSGEVEDYRLDVRPTHVTVGEMTLGSAPLPDVVLALAPPGSDLRAALAILAPEAAASLPEDASEDEMRRALAAYLDPDGDGKVALVRWETLEEQGTVGFYLERADGRGGWERINQGLLRGVVDAPMGAAYMLADRDARPGVTYQYRLIELEARGTTRSYGPFTIVMD